MFTLADYSRAYLRSNIGLWWGVLLSFRYGFLSFFDYPRAYDTLGFVQTAVGGSLILYSVNLLQKTEDEVSSHFRIPHIVSRWSMLGGVVAMTVPLLSLEHSLFLSMCVVGIAFLYFRYTIDQQPLWIGVVGAGGMCFMGLGFYFFVDFVYGGLLEINRYNTVEDFRTLVFFMSIYVGVVSLHVVLYRLLKFGAEAILARLVYIVISILLLLVYSIFLVKVLIPSSDVVSTFYVLGGLILPMMWMTLLYIYRQSIYTRMIYRLNFMILVMLLLIFPIFTLSWMYVAQ